MVDISGQTVGGSGGLHNGTVFGSQVPATLVCNFCCCNRSSKLASEYIVEFTCSRTKRKVIDPSSSELGTSKTPRTTRDVPDLIIFPRTVLEPLEKPPRDLMVYQSLFKIIQEPSENFKFFQMSLILLQTARPIPRQSNILPPPRVLLDSLVFPNREARPLPSNDFRKVSRSFQPVNVSQLMTTELFWQSNCKQFVSTRVTFGRVCFAQEYIKILPLPASFGYPRLLNILFGVHARVSWTFHFVDATQTIPIHTYQYLSRLAEPHV